MVVLECCRREAWTTDGERCRWTAGQPQPAGESAEARAGQGRTGRGEAAAGQGWRGPQLGGGNGGDIRRWRRHRVVAGVAARGFPGAWSSSLLRALPPPPDRLWLTGWTRTGAAHLPLSDKKKIPRADGLDRADRASFWPATVQDFGLGSVLDYLGPSPARGESALDRSEPKAHEPASSLNRGEAARDHEGPRGRIPLRKNRPKLSWPSGRPGTAQARLDEAGTVCAVPGRPTGLFLGKKNGPVQHIFL